jgi:hypothetical protein
LPELTNLGSRVQRRRGDPVGCPPSSFDDIRNSSTPISQTPFRNSRYIIFYPSAITSTTIRILGRVFSVVVVLDFYIAAGRQSNKTLLRPQYPLPLRHPTKPDIANILSYASSCWLQYPSDTGGLGVLAWGM